MLTRLFLLDLGLTDFPRQTALAYARHQLGLTPFPQGGMEMSSCSRPLAVARFVNDELDEIRILYSRPLQLDKSGKPSRCYWESGSPKEWDKLETVKNERPDDLHELEMIQRIAAGNELVWEVIDSARAAELQREFGGIPVRAHGR